MNLFHALPALRQHPFLDNKKVTLIGVSAIPYDEKACYFEIGKPKYWTKHESGGSLIGLGGIGGGIERGEGIVACLQREVKEELGARVRLKMSPQTHLIHDWQIADTLELQPSKKQPIPLMVVLTTPRLGGPDMPDHLAIVCFRTQLRGTPAPHDLFGLLRVERRFLSEFFARDEWPLDEAQAHPALHATLNGQPPPAPILRPILTARAFQILVRSGCAW